MNKRERATAITVAITVFVVAAILWGMYADGIFAQGSLFTLDNPGFEGVYTSRPGESEVKLPDGWAHWWDRENTPRPEYLEGDVTRLGKAVKQFTTYDNVDGGIQQEVYGVEPGTWYQFSIWAYYRSTPPGNKMSAMACINPWGDTRINYRTTVCGKEILNEPGVWHLVTVIAQAWSDKITVAGRFVAEWEFAYSDVFWDNANLDTVTIGGTCPTPAPCATVAPCPTAGVPGECATVEEIREIVREELDKTGLGAR